MKYVGDMFFSTGLDANGIVRDAVITSKRISIDWDENGIQGHLVAHSQDGKIFSGTYGYPSVDESQTLELMLFKAQGEVLLFGTWCDQREEGTWIFRLTGLLGVGVRQAKKG